MKRFWMAMVNVWLAFWLASCGAMQFSLSEAPATAMGLMETVQGMRSAVNGVAGTFVFRHPGTGWVALGWPQGSRYGFVIVDQAGNVFKSLKDLCGTSCNWREASDFTNWMIKTGWQQVAAPTIPAAIAGTVRQFAYLLSIGASLPVFPVLIIPMVINPLELLSAKGAA